MRSKVGPMRRAAIAPMLALVLSGCSHEPSGPVPDAAAKARASLIAGGVPVQASFTGAQIDAAGTTLCHAWDTSGVNDLTVPMNGRAGVNQGLTPEQSATLMLVLTEDYCPQFSADLESYAPAN